jgi:hypothetical protein
MEGPSEVSWVQLVSKNPGNFLIVVCSDIHPKLNKLQAKNTQNQQNLTI